MTEKELKKKERKEKTKEFLKKHWFDLALLGITVVGFGTIVKKYSDYVNAKLKNDTDDIRKVLLDCIENGGPKDALDLDLADLAKDIKEAIENEGIKDTWFERSYKNEILKKRKLLTVTVKEQGW